MGASKHIKIAMIEKDIKPATVAEKLGIENKQSFYNKISRDTMSFADAEKIADIMGCDIFFVDRENGKMY